MICFIVVTQLIYAMVILFAYRAGLKDGYKVYSGESVSDNILISEIKKDKPAPLTDEQISRLNVENYNGGAEGQVRMNV